MSNEKKWRVSPPLGSIMVPKEVMNEEEVREFAVQMIAEPSQLEVWKEKLLKDSMQDVLDWLTKAGYSISEA